MTIRMHALGNDPANSFGGPPRTPRVPLPPPTRVARMTTEVPRVTTSVPVIRPGDPPPAPTATAVDAPAFNPTLPAATWVKQPTVAAMPSGVTIPPPAHAPRAGVPAAPAARPAVALSPAALFGNDSAPAQMRRARKKRKTLKKLVTLLVLMAIAGGGTYAYREFVPKAPPHPDAWDARVMPYVQFVERERGLRFEHPIFVDFLTEAQYQEKFQAEAAASSRVDREDAQYQSELLDALGFTASYDLLSDRGTINASTTLGAYSPEQDRIVLRGDQLTPRVQATLVHELTHALQAQHFGLKGKAGDLSARSMAEADAMRVEDAYVEQLPEQDRLSAQAEGFLGPDEEKALDTVSWTLVELEYAPYALGPILLERAVTASGNAGADQLLQAPPSDDQLINPWATAPSGAVTLAAEEPPGGEVIERDTGLSLLEATVMLDAWLPWTMTRTALAAWEGARLTTYRMQGQGPLCAALEIAVQGDGAPLVDAMRWWTLFLTGAVKEPRVDTTTSPGSALVQLYLCARGPGSPEPPAAVIPTSSALAFELNAVPPQAMAPQAAARYLCTARALIDDQAAAPLLVQLLPTKAQQAQLDASMRAHFEQCG